MSDNNQIKTMQKLTVLFEAEILENGLRENASRSGIFFVAYNIFKNLLRDKQIQLYLYCWPTAVGRIRGYLQREFDCDLGARILVEGDDLSAINYFLSPFSTPSEYIKRFPQITCFTILHDTIPLIFPHYFGKPSDNSGFMKVARSINKNDFYFAVSEYTKRDFVKYVPAIDESKVTVIRLAADARFYPNKDVAEQQRVRLKYHIPLHGKYVFSLCTLEPRKNLIRAVSAFIAFIEKHQINDLVYVLGGGAWAQFIGRLEKEVPDYHKYADRIIQAGYVADEDLAVLLSNAEWFVYTSQYEGFGLPPLEAMQCGCPVIVSNNSSIPEVVGNAGIMIDYDSLEQHVQAYEMYYHDAKRREYYSQEGIKRAALFNWKNCTETIVGKMLEIERDKQQRPLVTVITTTYNQLQLQNGEVLLRQCLESVHQQDYPAVEHIVIDRSSTDGTVKVLEEYVTKGWITLRKETAENMFDAMNKGLAEAKGFYVSFLNPDGCFYEKRGIAISVEWLLKSGADYSFADTCYVSEDGKRRVEQGSLSKLLIGMCYCNESMFVKTEVLRDMGGFDVSCPVSADSDLAVRLYLQKRRSVHVPFCFLTHQEATLSDVELEAVRVAHSTVLYHHIGAYIGLTPCDCFLLWKELFFDELVWEEQIHLISKIPSEFGAEYLTRQFAKQLPLSMFAQQKRKFYLYGRWPIVTRRGRRNKVYYYLFDFVRLLKIVDRPKAGRKYYLFSIFPIWWKTK